jgi:small subunit ribosomal protein S1
MEGDRGQSTQQDGLARAEDLLASGEIVELEVIGTNRGGVLVRFDGLPGFVPNSQLPLGRAGKGRGGLFDRKKALVGSSLKLRVIEIDARRPSVIFGLAEESVPQAQDGAYSPGRIVSGTVEEISDGGVLLQLESASGFIHKSDLAWRWLKHPGDFVEVGETLEAKVVGAGNGEADLRLSCKELVANPWPIFGRIHKAGDLVLGTILQIRRSGMLVRLVPGVRGLVRRKDIDTPQADELEQIVSPGDKVTVRIAELDPKKEHIRLKMWWAAR